MLRLGVSLLVAGLTLGCGGDAGTERRNSPAGAALSKSGLARATSPSPANIAKLGEGNRVFAFDLYKQAASANAGANLVLSPYSVSTALAMTYAGARTATESEIKATLHFALEQAPLAEAFNATDLALQSRGQGLAGADDTPFQLNVGNSLWAQRGFPLVPAFLDTLAVNYGSGVFLTDFAKHPEASREAINDWVAEQTEDLITELLRADAVKSQTRMVLTNTVYFNASWREKFDPNFTKDGPFTKLDGTVVTAHLMNGLLPVLYAAGEDFQAVALPYSDALSMIAILPSEGRFTQLEDQLNGSWFDALTGRLRPSQAAVTMPKLDFKLHVSLKQALQALGMKAAFQGGADFSGMTTESVQIDDVIHESVIKVFEAGTIAAAATAVVIRAGSVNVAPPKVVLDRPFLFAIWDNPTGTILFVGRVLDPSVP